MNNHMKPGKTFDFNHFKHCFENKDFEDWLSFYRDDVEWHDYRQWSPPSNPHRMIGKASIASFLRSVTANNYLTLRLSDEVLSDKRIAFRVTCSFPDGRQIIENVIADIQDGQISRQVDVEAWDEGLH